MDTIDADIYLPLWPYLRAEPFKRSPFPSSTYEMAIGGADAVLVRAVKSPAYRERATQLLASLRALITLQDLSQDGGYRWEPVGGLWLEEHEKARGSAKGPPDHAWRNRSKVPRAVFSRLWEAELAPFVMYFNYHGDSPAS